MKGILTNNRFAVLHYAVDDACGSDVIMAEVDAGGAANGTLVLITDFNTDSDIRNIQVWTSSRSDFATSGTALAAIASDGLRQVVIVSDAKEVDGMFAKGITDGSISDLTVSTGTISSIDQDGMYVFNLTHLNRYVNVQYDAAGILTRLNCIFIGHDIDKAPWPGKTTVY